MGRVWAAAITIVRDGNLVFQENPLAGAVLLILRQKFSPGSGDDPLGQAIILLLLDPHYPPGSTSAIYL